jgi:uncharacterized protein YdeI (YjbR/CyaY-like superfamily)
MTGTNPSRESRITATRLPMESAPTGPGGLPILLFEDRDAWSEWLERNHGDSPGIWLRLAKKRAALRSVSYAEAVDVALCFGWIDSQKKGYDAASWLQRFSRRGPKSIWSKINREKVGALIDSGRMRPEGLAAVEAAREDGRWDAAYDSQRTATVPEDLQAELDRNPEAAAFFASLDGANRYAVLFRVQTAKRPETRAKRIAALVEMLGRKERIHP